MRYFRNSLLLFLLFLSSSVHSDGACWLDTQDDGTYVINCVGSGIVYQYEVIEETVYTYGNCVDIRSDMLDAIHELDNYAGGFLTDLSQIAAGSGSIRNTVSSASFSQKIDPSVASDINNSLNSIDSAISDASHNITSFENDLISLRQSVEGINCASSCPTNNPPGGGGGDSGGSDSCCDVDFSEILEKLNEAQETRESIEKKVKEISSACETISNTLGYVTFLLEQGFGSTTNELAMINSFLGSITNSVYSGNWYPIIDTQAMTLVRVYKRMDYNGGVRNYRLNDSRIASYSDPSKGYFSSFFSQGFLSTDALMSLNNYFYHYLTFSFPSLTNEVRILTQSATNYFSFFRSELSVLPVLADYETYSQDYDSYYDFLTNHYVQVSVGGSLSGNLQYKTNWFSRIETLLAALVFSDSQSVSNSVNVSSAESEANRVTEGLSNINTAASEHSQVLETSSSSIIQVFTSYCDIFDQAALPSQVTLVSFSSESSDQIENISFGLSSHPEFHLAIDYMRFVTTFCWSAAGILVLWKFLVWASKGFYLACKFVYIVITKTFK